MKGAEQRTGPGIDRKQSNSDQVRTMNYLKVFVLIAVWARMWWCPTPKVGASHWRSLGPLTDHSLIKGGWSLDYRPTGAYPNKVILQRGIRMNLPGRSYAAQSKATNGQHRVVEGIKWQKKDSTGFPLENEGLEKCAHTPWLWGSSVSVSAAVLSLTPSSSLS